VKYAKSELDKLSIPRSSVWVDGGGYVQFRKYYNSKSRRFRRYITKKRTGDELTGLDVHHKDEDRLNNTPDNLEVLTFEEHRSKHSSKAVRSDDKRFLWKETRKGEGNPNYGNRYTREPMTKSQINIMRRNQPGYVAIPRSELRDVINKYRKAGLVQKHFNITYKVYMNRCKEYGFEYRCTDNGKLPLISEEQP